MRKQKVGVDDNNVVRERVELLDLPFILFRVGAKNLVPMNRQQRRATRRRKLAAGTRITTRTIGIDTGAGTVLYWFEEPANFSDDDRARVLDHIVAEQTHPPGITLYGPFRTQAEVDEHQRLTLLGPQCEVTEGGMWDPAWDKPQ